MILYLNFEKNMEGFADQKRQYAIRFGCGLKFLKLINKLLCLID